MKLLVVFFLSLTVNAFAADRVGMVCTIAPEMKQGLKTYDAIIYSDDRIGFKTMDVFVNVGLTRKLLKRYDVQFSQNGNVLSLLDRKTGNAVLSYRNRAAPTREGQIIVEDVKTTARDAVCY